MKLDATTMYMLLGAGAFLFALLILSAFSTSEADDLQRRLTRVGPGGGLRKISTHDRAPQAVRRTTDSGIPLMNILIRLLPNPDKLRSRLARTGREMTLGEYLLVNVLLVLVFFLTFHTIGWSRVLVVPLSLALGMGLPHFVTGFMGARRLKKFLGNFPEAIDTMCRGIRSGLPVTESIAAVGREMPDPVGIEFHRIADGVRMGRTLEASMWEVTRRVSSPEFRFLIIAMAIQKETGGNLAETLGNLSDLIRKRRQLRLKIKAMSAEAKASAMIIGSLPFIMFTLLMIVNSEYMMTLFNSLAGEILMGVGVTWMSIGWAVMTKMIHFEI
ncbi:MAG: type II secretion system F family protein [Pseudomonadota bacterium]|nr:type II secretion system F family protein [Pseudomonadota bacterium]